MFDMKMDDLNKKSTKWILLLIFTAIIVIISLLFSNSDLNLTKIPSQSVVIYTSVDQVYSEPVLKEFEEQTGIKVLPVYDVEATKTTGLVNRLIAEKNRPLADVFWNGEFTQTILLKEEEVLAPYRSDSAWDIPAEYIDTESYWTGFGGRARILLVNTDQVPEDEYPKSIFDLPDHSRVGIAYPMFGTSATHAAALYAAIGPENTRNFYTRLESSGVRVVDGNSVVRDMVASGQLDMGLTDTDDACVAISKGAPVEMIFLDQYEEGIGTLIIPNTVALINGSSNPKEAKILIDYLLSRQVEESLVTSGWIQVSLRPVDAQAYCPIDPDIKDMNVSFYDIYIQNQQAKQDLQEIFIR